MIRGRHQYAQARPTSHRSDRHSDWALKVGVVLDWLRRLPRWLLNTLAVIAAGALWAYSQIAGRHGWWWVVVGGVLAAVAVGLPQLVQWQARVDEERLRVALAPDVLTQPREVSRSDPAIVAMLEKEEGDCLASLQKPPALGADPPTTVVQAAIARLANQYESTMSEPDKRTGEQYREAVQGYLRSLAAWAEKAAASEYAHRFTVEFVVTNPTDRTFEDTEIEIHVPGPIRAVDPSRLRDPPQAPSRPRAYGKRRPIVPLDATLGSMYGAALTARPPLGPPPARPRIDNSESARVTFPPVALRAHASVSLPPICLVPEAEAPGELTGDWSATAMNAKGRVTGPLLIRVSDEPGLAQSLLDVVLSGDDTDTDTDGETRTNPHA